MSSTLPPKPRMHRSSQTLATLGLCLLAAGFAGCNGVTTMTSVFNGLLNPADVGSYGVFGREGTLDIRSSLTLQDAPTGVMGVSDPQPEDLVPLVEEYEYAIGDGIAVRIYELLQRGTETAVQVTIDETGNINLPVLGRIEVVGLTLPEIEAEIVDQVVQRNILLEPEIIVEPAIRRKLSYTIYGTISQPNLYPLGQYNLRLLDAINVAGGLVDAVTEIYVVRNQNFPEPVLVSNRSGHHRQIAGTPRGEVLLSGGLGNGAGAAPATSTTMFSGDPKGSVLTTGDSGTTLPTSTPTTPATTTPSVPEWIYKNGEWVERQPTPSAAEQAPPTRQDRQELIETMTGRADSQAPPTATAAAPVPATPSQPRWIYYNGKWIETTTPTGEPVQTTTSKPEQAPDRPTQPSIDWGQIAGVEEEHRVIKISADSLRKGDPRHNIVVRAGDAIRLASGEFGEYYLMGQVMRPGAYSLTGRIITLKTAIASAGNLGQLAWPTHCTVYRRLGEREQMIQVNLDAIFTGKEQDFFIKKDDLILVGTHPVATFLAVLRNAFRISYGFGFVYDRNFADMDSYTSRPNPAYQQRQYPNLFR